MWFSNISLLYDCGWQRLQTDAFVECVWKIVTTHCKLHSIYLHSSPQLKGMQKQHPLQIYVNVAKNIYREITNNVLKLVSLEVPTPMWIRSL